MSHRWPPYAALGAQLVTVIAGTSLTAALLRGIDYVFLSQDETALTLAETALSIGDWGALLILAVTMAVGGYLIHRWPLTILGHALLLGIFAAFGVGAIATGLHNIDGAELRTGASFLLVQAVLHAVLTILAWRRWDHARE